MEDAGKAVGAILGLAALIFLMPLIGVLVGAFAGWVVSLFFDATMRAFFGPLGLGHLEVWQIGAALGFIGGFFKTTVPQNKGA